LQTIDVGAIEAILFDVNGTLRVRKAHEPTQHAAARRIMELLNLNEPHEKFLDRIKVRRKAYTEWAQKNLIQLSEQEIWSEWILPEYPQRYIEPIAEELTLAWEELKGRSTPRKEADETLGELKRRQYRLGLISNSMSTREIPACLENFGWKDLFDAVILASVLKRRKPDPEVFWEAAQRMGTEPSHCAFLGNRVSKDIRGCNRAGFGMAILIAPTEGTSTQEQDDVIEADAIIHSLREMLDIFPTRRGQNSVDELGA
jgi:putative hydrolase of the HAD superfamily